MSDVIPRDSELAEQAAEFAATITPERARWEYCLERGTYEAESKIYGTVRFVDEKAVPACARVLGRPRDAVRYRLGRVAQVGFDEALRVAMKRAHIISTPPFHVGPMEAWHVGHVYFARLESHPHVMKIGFSRRVRERLDEIASKSKAKLAVGPNGLKVGTMLDERYWHRRFRHQRIRGEWFFDPRSADLRLPDFLIEHEVA